MRIAISAVLCLFLLTSCKPTSLPSHAPISTTQKSFDDLSKVISEKAKAPHSVALEILENAGNPSIPGSAHARGKWVFVKGSSELNYIPRINASEISCDHATRRCREEIAWLCSDGDRVGEPGLLLPGQIEYRIIQQNQTFLVAVWSNRSEDGENSRELRISWKDKEARLIIRGRFGIRDPEIAQYVLQ